MIILDTNVLSALMIAKPEPRVVEWVDRQPPDEIWITSITVFEMRMGMALLPASKRRRAIEEAFILLLHEDLEHRILTFDVDAAVAAAALAAKRQKGGRTVDIRDTEIAGIALAHRATIATRNVRHFVDLDVSVIDPWTAV